MGGYRPKFHKNPQKMSVAMDTFEKIRLLREANHWTQEEMAERLDISVNSYARIERGESKLDLDRLKQIAQIFNINVLELVDSSQGAVFFISECAISDNTHGSGRFNSHNNYYGAAADLASEVEKLNLIVQHKDEIIAQQAQELAKLRKMIELLEKQ